LPALLLSVKLTIMKYKKHILPSGLRVIFIPMKDTQTAIGMVLVETGSHYEDKNVNGLSHFLEHMCFKGTSGRTGDDIKLELDGMGASSNAFTGEEYTGYYAKVHYKKLPKVIDIVSDIYINPTFPKKDIDIERGVIIEEINMYEDLPQRGVWEVLGELLYGDQPAGRTILGSKENIKKFQQEDFVKYHKEHYVADKTTFVVAGNFDEKKILKQVKEAFINVNDGKVIKKKKIKESQKGAQTKVKYKKTDQAHIAIGFRGFKMGDKRNFALKVAATVLGQGFSSRLFTKMRDELGMCYYTKAYSDTVTDAGLFVVNAGVGNKRAEEAVSVIMDEFKKLKDELVDEKELKKAKELILGSIATSLETSDQYADFFGFQELHHQDIVSPQEKYKNLKAVTAKDIQRVFNQIAKEDNLNLAIVGPFKDEGKFKKLLTI
jgi:predicted Zn-dependent peptidase